jgi:hypothetical protein
MAEKDVSQTTEVIENAAHVDEHERERQRAAEFEAPMQHIQELNEAEHINLSWRSWLVVFVTCFAIMAQVFVVVAAGSVIAFIIRDLGDAPLAGWIIRESKLIATRPWRLILA